MDEINAKFVRGTGSLNPSIEVCLSDGMKRTWWSDAISASAGEATPNERKKVIALLEKEIDSFETGDCPTVFRKMLRDLKDFGGPRYKWR